MENMNPSKPDTTWFTQARFGLFIHWGLYSLGAVDAWMRHGENLTDEDYRKYFDRFDPDLFDPAAWARAASQAGMKYMVATSKHHEGFCLWDSKLTEYKAPNTPARRDLLRPLLEAFRHEGLRTGLYHSLIDWHHPDFVLDAVFGPFRDHPDREKMNQSRDQSRYAAYLHGQVKELLTGYGSIDVLWFDFSYPQEQGGKGAKDWQADKLVKMAREIQPQVLFNDRLDHPESADFITAELFQPPQGLQAGGKPVLWEACQTFSGAWGYHRDEATWRSTEEVVRTLIDCVSKGGNLLLNVGPTGRGEFDGRALSRLQGIGEWMKRHGRSIHGCGQAPAEFICPTDSRLTYNPETKRLYVHLFAWPYKHLHLTGALAKRVAYAQLLNDASETRLGLHSFQPGTTSVAQAGTLTVNLPPVRPDVAVPVIELFLK
jgi:alpha-L-fucosidase